MQITKMAFATTSLSFCFTNKLFRHLMLSRTTVRYMRTNNLSYAAFGDPQEVLHLAKSTIEKPVANNQLLLHLLASPVNPADINMIQGVYPIKASFPAVGGNEGVFKVMEVGSDVSSLRRGELVIPRRAGFGCWREFAVCEDVDVIKISEKLSLTQAATLAINPCTAYRLLFDFVALRTGDVVIQNGANSAVGRAVIEFCRERNISSVNIVRQRTDLQALRQELLDIGATVVFADNEFSQVRKFVRDNPPVLGLNCVGGKNALEVARCLKKSAALVTYGGMSKRPVELPTGMLIFNDIRFFGFWLTEWSSREENQPERLRMLDFIANMYLEKKLSVPPHKLVKLADFRDAFRKDSKKSIFVT